MNKSIRDLLKESFEWDALPTLLYHGTPTKNVGNILENGLDPNFGVQGGGGCIYLTDDPFVAKNYAGMHMMQNKWTVLVIDGSQLDQAYAEPDDYEFQEMLDSLDEDNPNYGMSWNDFSWEESLESVNQIRYTQLIPPEAITVLDENENKQ